MRRPSRHAIAAIFGGVAQALLAAGPVVASDGRIEIDASRAALGGITPGDAPGFPVTLSQPGSYVLTEELLVPTGSSGVEVTSPEVAIDLNGFRVRSGFVCTPGACAAGSGQGVAVSPTTTPHVTVANGTIRGFASDCLALGPHARVERLQLRDCGNDAIRVGIGSHVVANRIDAIGRFGIALGGNDAYYGDNVIGDTAVGNPGGIAIVGGAPASGNVCADGSCSPRGARRYFLSTVSRPGDLVLSGCGASFHMASLYELLDPSGLEYDVRRGHTTADSGKGPPASVAGWIRGGAASSATLNCVNWTSNLGTRTGLRATLLPAASLGGAATRVSPWQVGSSGTCDVPARIWCVED